MRVPFWLIFLGSAAALYALSHFLPEDKALVASITVTEAGKTTLEYLQEMSKLITTLNTAMMAAAAALIVNGKEWTTSWSRLDAMLILLAFLSGAASYYGIYLGQISILEMISQGWLNPLSSKLQAAIAIEYYGTLVGVLLLGLAFSRLLEGRLRNAPTNP